ncbi:HNH endonuclease [Niveibacterium terrae]|uniref:HNH endonuclease n=1 Tax=Niveibacterium terrae TaxID=3373598 RepID=UPI003A8CBB68
MPTSITCFWNDSEIDIEEAIEIRDREESPLFQCIQCGERVKAHSGGGHTHAHFEHVNRNPECFLSHSDSYKYGGIKVESQQNPDAEVAIEGYAKERKFLAHYRRAEIVLLCKERDGFACKACGFSLRVNGRSVVECHHLVPLSEGGRRITSVNDLVCLCPTCHRVAHTSNPPLSIEEVSRLTKR